MRGYAIFEAEALGGTSVLGRLHRLVMNWRKRRKLRSLLELDDYLLSDIGLRRTEVLSAMQLALYVDPIAELERASSRASRRGVRSK